MGGAGAGLGDAGASVGLGFDLVVSSSVSRSVWPHVQPRLSVHERKRLREGGDAKARELEEED